jgi:PAS domain S-box-containing protein
MSQAEGAMNIGGNSPIILVPRLSGLFSMLAGVAGLFTCTPASATESETSKLVVVVYPSEYDGAPGVILVNRAIRTTFASQMSGHIDIRNEYVNTARLHDAEFMHAQVSLLKRKYAGRKVDLVIAGLSAGLDFAAKFREELFPGVPIIFVAVDEREVKARHLPSDVIGVPIRMDLTRTLELALRLHPDTKRVFVIAGTSPFDAEWEAEARRTFRVHEDELEFVYLTGLPIEELQGRVSDLPKQSIIYFLHLHQDSTGRPSYSAEVLERLASRANAPIYGHVDTYVGRGIVGGHVFSFDEAGSEAARLGLRVLSGEKAESIPISKVSANTDMFDWRQLRRWGISEKSLPSGSVVLFKEPTFWDVYRWHIVGVASLCVVETLLIAGLLTQLVRRRRAEQWFRQVVETAPTGMLMVGRDGTIVMANAKVEELFGYRRDELHGRPAGLLVPEYTWRQHPTASEQPISPRQNLFGRRKDGNEFPVEIGLSPLLIARGHFVLASIIDLTARRQGEDRLRESQRELQLLTGRLLEAQEVERRRIARELHDDLNQGLALLSVEMDLLADSGPDSPIANSDRLRELSAQIKVMSSAVHDLSHQLHPSKLEQLGLVGAVRGLCRELSQRHGLDVKFTHYPEPGAMSQDAALCLYRIVQEALQNVVKHSGSRHAAVELRGTPDAICLRVVDDGIGFDLDSVDKGGLGLVSMRERLYLVGGEIVIDARPAGGTRINVRIPVPIPSRAENALQTESAKG